MIRKKIRNHQVDESVDIKRWHNALCGVPAFLIGNGPSLENINLSSLENKFTIVINRAFLKIDPTILMWQDAELWWGHKAEISRLKSIRFCRDIADARKQFYHFHLERGGFKLPEDPSILYGSGTTGALSFQLAFSLGCNPIILLGFDCRYSNGKTDFYGVNASHKPHTLTNCNRGLIWIKECDSNRLIINCSSNNVFNDCTSLEEALAHPEISCASYSRSSLIKQLGLKA